MLLCVMFCIITTLLANIFVFVRASYSNYPGAAALQYLHDSREKCIVGTYLIHHLKTEDDRQVRTH